MLTNPEVAFIHKILTLGEMGEAVKCGLQHNKFITDEPAMWFKWLLEYYRSPEHPGAVPSMETFKFHFPRASFPKRAPKPELGEIVEMVRIKQVKSHLLRISNTLGEYATLEDIDSVLRGALASNQELMELLYRTRGQDVCYLSSDVEAAFEEYEFRKQGGLRGVLWPWAVVNEKAGGIENGELVTLYGRPKQLKSWLALVIAVNYYLFSYSGRVLIYSCEMKKELFRRRIAAVVSRIHYGRYRAGKLTADEEERFYSSLKSLKQAELDACTNGHKKELIIVKPGEEMGLLDLQAKVEELHPDFVVVDGVQNMADGAGADKTDTKAQTGLSWNLKHRVAEHYDLPLLAVHQANRGESGEELDDLAFSDGWARDSDVLIKAHKLRTDTHGQLCALFFAGAREYDMAGVFVQAKPAYNFGFIEEIHSLEHFKSYLKANKEKNEQGEESRRRVQDYKQNIARNGGRIVL